MGIMSLKQFIEALRSLTHHIIVSHEPEADHPRRYRYEPKTGDPCRYRGRAAGHFGAVG